MIISIFRVDLTDIPAKKEALLLRRSEGCLYPKVSSVADSASVFKIKLNGLLQTMIQKIFIQILKINNFRSDSTNVSAKQEPLVAECFTHVG